MSAPALFVLSLVVGFLFYSQQSAVAAAAMALAGRRGFGAAMGFQTGVLAGDAVWAGAGLAVFALVAQIQALQVILSIVGSFLMLRFAWSAIQESRQGLASTTAVQQQSTDFRSGANLSFRNPYALGFWLGIAAATILLVTPNPGFPDYVLCWTGMMAGALVWCLLAAALGSRETRDGTAPSLRIFNLLVGVLLALLGVYTLWHLLTTMQTA